MLTKSLFIKEHFDHGLVEAVGDRLAKELYTDAILAGGRFLTDTLRTKGQVDGDGVALVNTVLGGSAPILRINSLLTQSERDEQKGVLQIAMGFYTGIRNPRTHEASQDTEDECIRMLVLIDTLLAYLNRVVAEFDVSTVVNRIYEPHFVASREYAQALTAEVPANKALEVYKEAFERRSEGKIADAKYVFHALEDMLSDEGKAETVQTIAAELATAKQHSEITSLLPILKPEAWAHLPEQVRLRLENIIIDDCKNGTVDIFSDQLTGQLGTWGNTFGPHFDRREDLAGALQERMVQGWYSQNYVAKYFMNVLPLIVRGNEAVKQAADNLAYAAINNQAKLLRTELLSICVNYPEEWKAALRVAVQERKHSDEQYADTLLEKLS